MAKKKPNPRRRPATMADVEKAKKEAENFAAAYAMAIIFTALTDKMGWTVDQLQELWGHVEYLSESVTKGYVTVPQLVHTLREEYGIGIGQKEK